MTAEDEFQNNNGEDKPSPFTVEPVVRAASMAAVVASAFGMPSLWKTMKKNMVRGLPDSLVSIIYKKKNPTFADKLVIFGKYATDLSKDPRVINNIENNSLKQKEQHNSSVEDSLKKDVEIFSEMQVGKEQRLKDIEEFESMGVSKSSLFERVDIIDKELQSKNDYGRRNYGRIPRKFFSTNMADKVEFVHKSAASKNIATSDSIKRSVIINAFRGSDQSTKDALFPGIASMSEERVMNEIPDEVISKIFDNLMHTGSPIAQEIGRNFIRLVQDKQPSLIVPFGYKGQAIKLSDIRSNYVLSKQLPHLTWDGNNPFIKLAMKPDHSKTPPKKIMFDNAHSIDDMMAHIDEAFMHLKTPVFGNARGEMKSLLGEYWEEYQKAHPSVRATRKAGIRVDKERSQIVFFVQDESNLIDKLKPIYLSVPTRDRAYHFGSNASVLDTLMIAKHGQASMEISSFERTLKELHGLLKRGIRAHVIEPDLSGDEIGRIQSKINKQYYIQRRSHVPIQDFYRSRGIRADNPLLFEKKRARVNRNLGVTMHTAIRAAKNEGKSYVVYDQEFISTRKGPQLISNAVHDATPYQITATKYSADGRVIGRFDRYIKTRRFNKITNAYANNKMDDSDLLDFQDSLKFTGRANDMGSILSKVADDSTQNAREVYADFENFISGSMVIDHGGKSGSPDQAIIKFITGRDLFHPENTIDTLHLLKSASSMRYGWSKDSQWKKLMLDALSSDSAFDKLQSKFMNYANKTVHRKLLDTWQQKMMHTKNKREAFIQAVLAEAHEANIDIAMQTMLLDEAHNKTPLMGIVGSNLHQHDKIMRSSLTIQERINVINTHEIIRHYGSTDAEDTMNNYDALARSSRQVTQGAFSAVSASAFNIFELGNTGMKQIHQKFQVMPIHTPNKWKSHGYLNPVTSALREVIEHNGKNAVGDNIGVAAERVNMIAYVLPAGYGDLPEGSIVTNMDMIKDFNHEYDADVSNIMLGKEGHIKDIHVKQYLHDMKNSDKMRQLFPFLKDHGDTNFWLHDDFNECARTYSEMKDSEVAKDIQEGLIQSGSSKHWNIKQGDRIISGVNGQTKHVVAERSRISSLSRMINKEGVVSLQLGLKSLERVQKMTIGNRKGLTLPDKIHHYAGYRPQDAVDDIFGLAHKSIFAVASYAMMDRGEFGTEKEILVNRVYGTYMANNQPQKAKNFLLSLDAGHVIDTKSGAVLMTHSDSVQQSVDLYNSMDFSKLYQGHIDAGITYKKNDIRLFMEHYGLEYKSMQHNVEAIDEVLARQWNIDNPNKAIKQLRGKTWRDTLDAARDNEDIKFMRMVNPYFHVTKNQIVDPEHDPVARLIMDPRIDKYGKPVLGRAIGVRVETNLAQARQFGKPRAKIVYAPAYTQKELDLIDPTARFSPVRPIIERTLGKVKHTMRSSALNVIAHHLGSEQLKNVHHIDGGIDEMLQRTMTYDSIMKQYGNGIFSESELTGSNFAKLIKDTQAKEWHNRTTSVYEDKAKSLLTQIEHANPLEKDELLKQYQAMKRMARLAPSRMVDLGDNITFDQVKKRVGTFWEVNQRTPMSREFLAGQTLNMGGRTISPNDALAFNKIATSKAYGTKFIEEVLNNVDQLNAAQGDSLYRSSTIKKAAREITKNLQHGLSASHEGTIHFGSGMILMTAEVDSRMLERGATQHTTLMDSHVAAIHATNEANNAASAEAQGVLSQIEYEHAVKYYSEMIYAWTGKNRGDRKALFYGDRQFSSTGLYSQVQGVTQSYHAIERGAQKIKADLVGRNKWLPRWDNTELRKAQIMTSGSRVLIGQDAFKSQMIGDVSAMDYYHKLAGGGKEGDLYVKKILAGEVDVFIGVGRNPFDTNDLKVSNQLGRVSKFVEGIVIPHHIAAGIKSDADGDLAQWQLHAFENMKQMNEAIEFQKHAMHRKGALIAEYQTKALKDGFESARSYMREKYQNKDFMGYNTRAGELTHIINLSETLLQDGVTRTAQDKIDPSMWIEGKISKDRAHFLNNKGNLLAVGKLYQALNKPIDSIEHRIERGSLARAQTMAAHGVGVMESFANRTKIRLFEMQDFLTKRLEQGGSIHEDIIKSMSQLNMFDGVNMKDLGAIHNRVGEVMEEHLTSMKESIFNITKHLHKPGQEFISFKKATGENLEDSLMGMINDPGGFMFNEEHKNVRRWYGDCMTDNSASRLKDLHTLAYALEKHDKVHGARVQHALSFVASKGITAGDTYMMAQENFIGKALGSASSGSLEDLMGIAGDELTSKFSEKTAQGWRNAAKQILFSKHGKSALAMGVGLSLFTFANPNQMSGGIQDFGMDLGARPGFNSSSGVEKESLSPEPGSDVFSKQWSYLLNNDPVLKDNMDELSGKSYKNLNINKKSYSMTTPEKKYKRNYIDFRKSYNARYETNDMRRNNIPGF